MRIVEGARLKSSRLIPISSPTTSLRCYNTRPRLCPNVSCRCSVRFLVDNGVSTGRLAAEVIAHLARLVGSSVKVTLEIEAEIEGGSSGAGRPHRHRERTHLEVHHPRVLAGVGKASARARG